MPQINVNLVNQFSAYVWAGEWTKAIKNNPDIPYDEGAMIAWFANAIMAGYDEALRRQESPTMFLIKND